MRYDARDQPSLSSTYGSTYAWLTWRTALSPRITGRTVLSLVAPRARLTDALTLEAGVRYDRESWLDEGTVSPRASLTYTPDERTTVHAAWGRYTQPMGLYELQVQDGVHQFARA